MFIIIVGSINVGNSNIVIVNGRVNNDISALRVSYYFIDGKC